MQEPKTIQESVIFYKTASLEPVKLVRALLKDKFTKKEIIENYQIEPSQKPLYGGSGSAYIGVLYIIAAIFGFFTLGSVFGSFHYLFRGTGDMIRANALVIRPFLALASFVIGIGLLVNRGTFSYSAKMGMTFITLLSLFFSLSGRYLLGLVFPISLLILYYFTKSPRKGDKGDIELIIEHVVGKQKTEEEIIEIINTKPRKGTYFALVIFFCLWLYFNSPIHVGRGLSVPNMDQMIAYLYTALTMLALPVGIFLWFRKNVVIIGIYAGLAALTGLLLLMHNNSQTGIIPSAILAVLGLVSIVYPIFKERKQEIKDLSQ